MNRLIKILFLTCVFLLTLYYNKLFAQDFLNHKADNLFENGQYQAAALAYEYECFSNNHHDSIISICLFKKGLCHKQLQEYNNAISCFNRIKDSKLNDSIYKKLLFEKALCYYLTENYDEAVYYIHLYKMLNPTDNWNKTVELTQILSLLNNKKLEEAQAQLIQYNSIYPLHFSPDSLFTSLKEDLHKNNSKKALSKAKIYPGFGLLYLKNYQLGVSNILIQAGLVTYTTLSFASGMYFNGLFGTNLMYRFYRGQIERTKIWTEYKENEIIKKYIKSIKTKIN